jgi:hypothetical protein
VDTSAQAPIGGDYEGVDPSGLFWSARFDQGADAATMIAALGTLEMMSAEGQKSKGKGQRSGQK